MDEMNVLENALLSCKTLEKSVRESLLMVRRLNIRHNSDLLMKNYKRYVSNIWMHYTDYKQDKPLEAENASVTTHPTFVLPSPKLAKTLGLPSPSIPIVQMPMVRSSRELRCNSQRINYHFLKIKRGLEAALVKLQRTIEIANRQRNYSHFRVPLWEQEQGRLQRCHLK